MSDLNRLQCVHLFKCVTWTSFTKISKGNRFEVKLNKVYSESFEFATHWHVC